jgi:hypothetical protein
MMKYNAPASTVMSTSSQPVRHSFSYRGAMDDKQPGLSFVPEAGEAPTSGHPTGDGQHDQGECEADSACQRE